MHSRRCRHSKAANSLQRDMEKGYLQVPLVELGQKVFTNHALHTQLCAQLCPFQLATKRMDVQAKKKKASSYCPRHPLLTGSRITSQIALIATKTMKTSNLKPASRHQTSDPIEASSGDMHDSNQQE